MSRILYINKTFGESRAALVENGRLEDFFMERGEAPLKVGNLYKGRVSKVLPGLGSAFVDIGQEKAAYLYLDKAWLPSCEEPQTRAKSKDCAEGGRIIPDEFETFCDFSGSLPPDVTIDSLLRKGDEVLLQISRESIGNKGPKATRNITLASRYLVYMPFVEHLGVSRRIAPEEERMRLEGVLKEFCSGGQGAIVRTSAKGQSTSTLRADFSRLEQQWKSIREKYETVNAPGLCHEESSFVRRILRDIVDDELDHICVDTVDVLEEVEHCIKGFLPALEGKCRLYREADPIFEKFGIEREVKRALSNKIYLRSGGTVNIDQTEALVSIDVNTGKFVGKNNLNETILEANLEAAKEIARQLRLRNCGGIIVIDFIDMVRSEHQEQVFRFLLDALQKDRAKYSVMPISGLGLVEMTRKQTRDTLVRLTCLPCQYCDGSGRVKSISTVCYDLLRELMATLKKRSGKNGDIHIYANPEVIDRLYDEEEFGFMDELEESWGKPFEVRSDGNYHVEQYDIFFKD